MGLNNFQKKRVYAFAEEIFAVLINVHNVYFFVEVFTPSLQSGAYCKIFNRIHNLSFAPMQ
jgi:hypothetical protein